MTKTLSNARRLPAEISELSLSLVVESGRTSSARAAEIKSRPEPSKVVHVAFGEWPVPAVTHPDSMSVATFVHSLEADGHAEQLAEGRRAISSWFDTKPSLRKLRLAQGLSQAQLAELMGTSQAQIARMESGQDLHISTVKRLARALKIDIRQIVDVFGD